MTALLLASVLAAAAGDAKPVVSVLYFENRTGNADLDVLRKGLSEMMVTDLVAWDGVTVVERDRLEAVLSELKLQSTKSFDKATTVKVGKLVGAQYTIEGTINRQGETLRVDATLRKVETGVVVGQARAEDHQDKIFDIEQQLVDKLTVAIDLKLKDASQRKRAKAPNLDALLQYSKAIDLSDRGRFEEAQKAMAAVVSKSPTFGMARERKEYLAKKLEEYEARRKDMVTEAVAEIGRLTEAELAKAKDFAKLPREAQEQALLMRGLRAQFLARLLKQSLSWRLDHPRVIKLGKEADALKVMQAWLDNQRRFVDEAATWKPEYGVRTSLSVKAELAERVKAAGFKDSVQVEPTGLLMDALEFVALGELNDGERFVVAPPLGVLMPKELDLAFGELDEALTRAEAAWKQGKPGDRRYEEGVLGGALRDKGALLVALRRDDDAAAAYQRLLDTMPDSDWAKDAERAIKDIIEGKGNERRDHAEYEEDLATCDDFHIPGEIGWHLRRGGLKGLDEISRIMESKCLGYPGLSSSWSNFFSALASEAAKAEDCERARRWFLARYVWGETGPYEYDKYLRRDYPWCELGLSEDKLPSLVRVTVTSSGYKDKRQPLIAKGLAELLPGEFAARGVALETGGSYHGGNRSIYFDPELKGDELVLTIRTSDDNERRPVSSKNGQLVLSDLIDPFFKTLRTGAPTGPFKANKTIALPLALEVGEAMDLFEDRKWGEARQAFEALAKKHPEHWVLRMRADMAAAKERKEKSR